MSKNAKLILGAAVFIVLAVLLSRVIINGKDKINKDLEITQKVFDQQWEETRIADEGIVIYAPEGLRKIETVLDEGAKKVLQKYSAYEYTVGSFTLKINHITANTRLDPDSYADKLAEMFEASDEYKGYSSKKQDMEQGGAYGIFLKGSGMHSGIDMIINSLILVKDNELWDITMILNSSSHELKVLMEEVLSSIVIL